MNVLGVILLGVLAAFAARYLIARRPSQRRKRELKALLDECNGDQDLVERLVLSEMDRDERLGFAEAARRARARLRRDRR